MPAIQVHEKTVMIDETRARPDDYFVDWKLREELAEAMIPLVGQLYRKRSVKVYIFGHLIVNKSVLDIMKIHRQVRQVEKNELSEKETHPVVQILSRLNLGTAHVDAGKLAVKFETEGAGRSLEEFIGAEVADILDSDTKPIDKPRDVVLYGFGRIGRLVARLLIEKTGGGDTMRLRAIVVRKGKAPNDLVKRASLLRRDSVHGPFDGTIRVDEERCSMVVNGNEVRVIYASSPQEIDYTDYGINNAIVVDNTGMWRDEKGLSQHLDCNGVGKVLLTAPGKGGLKNVVFGINTEEITPEDKIITAASCTTNAIAPPLKALDDKFGVETGHIETVHSFTNDQNLIDNYHSADRRGRAASINMVLTETGAAKAVGKVLPQLQGKLTGNAVRVPTPNVSIAILNLELKQAVERDDLNEFMRQVALHSPMSRQMDYSNSPEVVSSDFVGSRRACVFDSEATIVNGTRAVLYCWYDNEFGYSCQVIRILERMSGLKYAVIP